MNTTGATKKKGVASLLRVNKLSLPRTGGNWADPSCYIGLEIEAEGISYKTAGKKIAFEHVYANLVDAGWDIATDGSLRNDGREFRFSTPMLGFDLRKAIDTFYEHVEFEESPRAGIHIHVDWTTVEDADSINTLMAILYCLEPALFELIGRGRKDCVYCKPLTAATTEELLKMFTADFEHGSALFLDGSITRRHHEMRYFGANILSLSKFGTVEFRYFPSVCDKQKMEEWLYLVQLLRRAAVDCGLTPTEVFKLMSTNDGVVGFVRKWFAYANMSAQILPHINLAEVTESARVMALLCESERVKEPTRAAPKMSKAMARLIDNKYTDVRKLMERKEALKKAIAGDGRGTRNIIDVLINEQNG